MGDTREGKGLGGLGEEGQLLGVIGEDLVNLTGQRWKGPTQ